MKKTMLLLVVLLLLVGCGKSAQSINTDINEIDLQAGDVFDPTMFFEIRDNQGVDVTDQMTYTGTLDTMTLGTYKIKLEITVNKTLYRHPLTVNVIDTTPPTLDLVKPHFFYIKGTTKNASLGIKGVSDNLDKDLTIDQVVIEEEWIGMTNELSEPASTYRLTYSLTDSQGNQAKQTIKGFEVMALRYINNSVKADENFIQPIYDHAYQLGYQIRILGNFDYDLYVVMTVEEAIAILDQHTGAKYIAVYTDYPNSVNGIALFLGK